MKIHTYNEALNFLYKRSAIDPKKKFPGELGIRRTSKFLELLGNPQDKLKVIHVAGTSGKGSTAYLTSKILHSLGIKVGLHLSPHLLDIRERMQLNHKLISKKEFVELLNSLLPTIFMIDKTPLGKPTYFEILTVMSFVLFKNHNIDYAVIETGMGGWYDATNRVTRKDKICVITRIGLDHTQVLGKTIPKIAYQKAMIIKAENTVITINQDKQVGDVINKMVQKRSAVLIEIEKGRNYKNILVDSKGAFFDYSFDSFNLSNLRLGIVGSFQAENCSLALSVVFYLSKRDRFKLRKETIRQVLAKANFRGRFDIFKINGKRIIVDGAHNPQKMKAFTENLREIYKDQKFSFIVAFKKGKEYKKMLAYILLFAERVYLTSFSHKKTRLTSINPRELATYAEPQDKKRYIIADNIYTAWQKAFQKKEDIVITGSLYLVSSAYSRLKN